MVLSRRARIALAAVACAAAVVPALPASAAGDLAPRASTVPGWRIFFTHACASPNGCGYFAVAASGRLNAWATGIAGGNGSPASGRPIAARWHNGAWQVSRLPSGLSGLLIAVSTDSASDAWTVSADGGYVLHWNGTRWSVARRWHEGALPRELTGVTAFGPRDVWVFGGPGADPGLGTWHFNGSSWTNVATGPGAGIVEASALSPANMWAIGSASAPQDSIVHYTGTWRQVHASVLSGLQFSAITAISAGDVWAAATIGGNPSAAYVVRLRNGRWARSRLPWPVNPVRMAGDGHGGIWLTAENSSGAWVIIHGSAFGQWTRQALGSHRSMIGLALIPGTAALWGAGGEASTSAHAATVWAYGKVR